MRKQKILFSLLLLTSMIVIGCGNANQKIEKQLTAKECEAYKFDFNDVSEIYFPKESWQEVKGKDGLIRMEPQLYFVYLDKKVIPYDIANSCMDFVAKGADINKIPEKCVFLINAETYWAKKPECAKIIENDKISKNCHFMCSKNKCYTMYDLGYLYSGETESFAEFDEDKAMPSDFYDDSNTCGYKYFQP